MCCYTDLAEGKKCPTVLPAVEPPQWSCTNYDIRRCSNCFYEKFINWGVENKPELQTQTFTHTITNWFSFPLSKDILQPLASWPRWSTATRWHHKSSLHYETDKVGQKGGKQIKTRRDWPYTYPSVDYLIPRRLVESWEELLYGRSSFGLKE